jgi:hypothetical protein
MALVLAGVSCSAFAMLKPGAGVSNSELVKYMTIAGWAIGPVAALLSFVGICLLNLLRRMFKLRRVNMLHPVILLIGFVPWVVFSWILLDEPRYTEFAVGVMEFVARPLLWGSLIATLLTIIFSIPLFFPKKK